jgi:hypothetical protein
VLLDLRDGLPVLVVLLSALLALHLMGGLTTKGQEACHRVPNQATSLAADRYAPVARGIQRRALAIVTASSGAALVGRLELAGLAHPGPSTCG